MHHAVFFPWVGFLFFFLILGFFIMNIMRWRRYGGYCHSGGFSALEMLEKRYVSGEINEDEFKKMRENLKR